MPGLNRGLYELLITEALAAQLRELADGYSHEQTALRAPEAPDRIALHLSQVIHRALESLPDKGRVAAAVALARALLDQIAASVPASDARAAIPLEAGDVLRLVAARLPDGRPEAIPTPLIPLLDTTLLTNAPGEPRVGHQIATEILSADQIDVVMAFVRRSGIAPAHGPLRAYCQAGRPLRMLTTTYTGSTEARGNRGAPPARRRRARLLRHRLHSPARQGLAVPPSLRLLDRLHRLLQPHPRRPDAGLEWNVRVSGARNRDVIQKMTRSSRATGTAGTSSPTTGTSSSDRSKAAATRAFHPPESIEVRLEPFQERLLEQIALARQRGHHRNLLVVRHRHRQDGDGRGGLFPTPPGCRAPACCSWPTARRSSTRAWPRSATALREHAFGEQWVGGARPDAVRTRLCLDPEPQRLRARPTSTPPISTWSSSTSSITPPRPPTGRCSTACVPSNCSA